MNFFFLFKIFFSACFISFITTKLTIWFYSSSGWLDDPQKKTKSNVLHQYPVPRGGGIPIFISLLIASLFFLPLDKHLLGILLSSFLILIIGIFDDLYNLNPYFRLFIGFLASLVVIAAGIGIPYITNPFGGIIKLNQPQIAFFLFGKTRTIWLLADIFALFWLTWCMNFVNWTKGIDGQLPGVVVIASLTIAFLSLKFSADITQWPVIILALITAGAYFGFLFWNFYPQKIMPGYGAGALAGFLLGVLTILSNTKVGTAMMVLAIPLLDAFYTIFRRIKAGRSPVWPDAGHLHHLLFKLGWSKRKIAFFYWLITAFFGILALVLNPKAKLYTIIIAALMLGSLLLWLNYFILFSSPPDRCNGLKI